VREIRDLKDSKRFSGTKRFFFFCLKFLGFFFLIIYIQT
jgi:hypothetical protein